MNTSKASSNNLGPPLKAVNGVSNEQGKRSTHRPRIESITTPPSQSCSVKRLTIKVRDERTSPVRAFLHIPQQDHQSRGQGRNKAALILLSGADGGMDGPSSLYPSLAAKMANRSGGLPVMRLDYRYPAQMKYCIQDVLAGMEYLENRYSISRFVLVGWSFGGALVAMIGGNDNRVIGCAMIASQLAETSGVESMAPRPLLLIHGTDDMTMRYSCSEELFEMYGDCGQRDLKLIDGDDHELSEYMEEVEKMLIDHVVRCITTDAEIFVRWHWEGAVE